MWFNPDCPRSQQAGSVIVKSLMGFIMGASSFDEKGSPPSQLDYSLIKFPFLKRYAVLLPQRLILCIVESIIIVVLLS